MHKPLFALLLATSALAAASLAACEGGSTATETDYTPLLRSVADDVAQPEHAAFSAKADALLATARAFETTPDAASLDAMQTAWSEARAAYRKLDALFYGPIADLGIDDRIDGTTDPAQVDAMVDGAGPVDLAAVAGAGGKAKGFLGVEYLLFSPTRTEALSRLSGDGPAARRRALARAMCEEIAQSAHQLEDAWAVGKGGYAAELTGAGDSSERYASQRAAVDDIVGGVGYALEIVVGIRLAFPLGRKTTGKPDPTLDPTRLSDSAVADMLASLEGVSAVYGAEGFSARVRERSPALESRVQNELAACSAKISAIPRPFAASVTNDTASVQAAFDACKAFKLTWNTEVTSALGATLKPADNDGD